MISRHPRKHIVLDSKGTELFRGGVNDVFDAYADFGDGKDVRILMPRLAQADIYEGGIAVGTICPKLCETGKLFNRLPIGYEYWQIDYQGKQCQTYNVGLGKNQHYICFYNDGKTIAIAHKDDLVKNYCNTYTLYIENMSYFRIVMAVLMIMEATVFCDRTSGMGYCENNNSFYNAQKGLREKYDPTFIPRIKEMNNWGGSQ